MPLNTTKINNAKTLVDVLFIRAYLTGAISYADHAEILFKQLGDGEISQELQDIATKLNQIRKYAQSLMPSEEIAGVEQEKARRNYSHRSGSVTH